MQCATCVTLSQVTLSLCGNRVQTSARSKTVLIHNDEIAFTLIYADFMFTVMDGVC